ncbi:hypothetical protein [Sulfurimonas marina]|uniref:Tetratricopeptide repeat protein n=1 Tax=Sulfurimonas marina TaxID=2590551 RepID=A0A7M3V9A4_9BACT|nr:hypothetical protein [Sulfurimonas marina]QOP40337.1 hypothetical protein FJR03_00690 [Sulfurimonas marina]
MYDVNNEEAVYVVTYKELLFTVIVFLIILFALYPKGILKDQISADQSNYDLSMIYLKDLLEHNPNDDSLKLILLEKYVQAGEIEHSLELSKSLLQSKNIYIRNKAIVLAYQTKKIKYFSINDEKQQKALHNDLKKLFTTIYTEKLYNDNAERWHNEAVFVHNPQAAYYFLQIMLKDDPTNVDLLREGYYLSLNLYKRADSMEFINSLEKYDTSNSTKWAMDKYDIFIRYKDYKSAETILQRYAKDSIEIQEKLAQFYLMIKKYEAASDTYLKLYYVSKNEDLQEQYLVKSIKALQSGNLLKEAANLVHQYESKYIGNVKMRKFFLRIYLAAGELEYASQLSKKILRYENKL